MYMLFNSIIGLVFKRYHPMFHKFTNVFGKAVMKYYSITIKAYSDYLQDDKWSIIQRT